jgi:nucleolin
MSSKSAGQKRSRPDSASEPKEEAAAAAAAAAAAPAARKGSAPAPAAAQLPAHALQVYAAGLPYTATEADIRAFFASCGDITLITAPTFQDTGRLRGFAHVTFSAAAGVERALELDGKYLGDRFVSVERAKPAFGAAAAASGGSSALPQQPKGCSKLFVKNLPYEAGEEALQRAFAAFGTVVAARVVRRSDNQVSKGFAYVEMEASGQALAAMQAACKLKLLVSGRPARLDYDTGAPKASFKAQDGRALTKGAGAGSGSGSGSGSWGAARGGRGGAHAGRGGKRVHIPNAGVAGHSAAAAASED